MDLFRPFVVYRGFYFICYYYNILSIGYNDNKAFLSSVNKMINLTLFVGAISTFKAHIFWRGAGILRMRVKTWRLATGKKW